MITRGATAALVGLIAILLGGSAADAQSSEVIHRYGVAIQIERDDSIVVRETIDYDFGTVLHHGIFRDIPTTLRYDDAHDRTYPLDEDQDRGSRPNDHRPAHLRHHVPHGWGPERVPRSRRAVLERGRARLVRPHPAGEGEGLGPRFDRPDRLLRGAGGLEPGL